MKKPKINVKLKMPDKKPTIKNRFLQKNLLSLIVIAVLAIGTGTAYGTLSSQDADRGNDPVNGVNQDRYQVLISGKGYKLSKKQEKDYKLQKKQNEANVNKAAQDNPNVIRSSSGSRIFRSGSSSYRYSGGTYKPSKIPKLSTDILKRKKEKSTWKAGDKLSFIVTALAYPYGTKNAIPSDSIKVTINGKAVSCDNSDDGDNFYTVVLEEGTNTINISATDKKTKKTSKLGPFVINKVTGNNGSGGSNTNPSNNTDTPSAEEITKATVNLSEYGLDSIELSDASLNSIIEKAKDKQKIEVIEFENLDGFTMGDYENGDILKKYKNEKGITEELNDEQFADYKAWFNGKEKNVRDDKKLGKGYPFNETCWEYSVEGDTVKLELNLFGD